jgi:hypothetical protein
MKDLLMDGIRKASLPLSLAALILVAASASPAGEPPSPDAVARPFFQVVPRQDSAGGDREIQAMAAALMSRQAEQDRTVPEGRARGWTGNIVDQAALPSGVRVRVHPVLEGGWCAVDSYLDETYLIRDGIARLATIEFSDRRQPRCLAN